MRGKRLCPVCGEALPRCPCVTTVGRQRRSTSPAIAAARDIQKALRLRSWLYAITYEHPIPDALPMPVKIGYAKNLVKRIDEYQSMTGLIVWPLVYAPGEIKDEAEIHHTLKVKSAARARGREWYWPTPPLLAVLGALASRPFARSHRLTEYMDTMALTMTPMVAAL